ncbi:hypothetical protein ACH4Q6_16275 [Streptomyces lydicus]|uniref:hypothetical protein n=1 Tax=Streptomyces lydicus TaxID=47763 RepID=UPI0037ADD9FD
MNAWVGAPGAAPPEGGALPPAREVRGRVGSRLTREPEPALCKRNRRRERADLSKTVSGRIRRIDPRERTARGAGGAEYWEENHR